MQEKYTSNGVIERGYAIYDEWNENKYKSRKIVNSVQMTVAFTNAIRTPDSYIEALSHLFALDLRISERYANVLACIMLYFSWRRETREMKRLRDMMKLPDIGDIRAIIEVEIERLRGRMDGDGAVWDDKNTRGGRVNGFSENETVATTGELQNDANAEETLEEGHDAENSEEKSEELGEFESAEEQINETKTDKSDTTENTEKSEKSEAHHEKSEKAQGESADTVREDGAEDRQEKNYDDKLENNGSAEKKGPLTDKIKDNNGRSGYNGAIDVPFAYEEMQRSGNSDAVSFIDEVIIDNMIKGEDDIIAHNPLEGIKQESGDHLQNSVTAAFENRNADVKDAHLYDKIVLNSKDTGILNNEKAPQEKVMNVPDAPQDKVQIAENKEPAPAYNKPESMRIQINVQDNVSEENAFRRSINDKFTEAMINIHKSLMEEAFREEFIIPSEELGMDAPIDMIENNFEDLRASVASVKNH